MKSKKRVTLEMPECYGKYNGSCEPCDYEQACKISSKHCNKILRADMVDAPDIELSYDFELPSENEISVEQADDFSINLPMLFKHVLEVGDFNSDRCMVIFARACGYSYSEIGLLIGGKSKQMIGKHVNAIKRKNARLGELLGVRFHCKMDFKLIKRERKFDSCLKKLKK